MVPSENLTVSFFVTPSVCNKADPFQCTNGPKRCHSLQNHTLAFTSDYICAFLCTLRQPLQSGATSDPPFCPADTGLAAQLRLGWRMTHCSLISCKWLSSWVSGAQLWLTNYWSLCPRVPIRTSIPLLSIYFPQACELILSPYVIPELVQAQLFSLYLQQNWAFTYISKIFSPSGWSSSVLQILDTGLLFQTVKYFRIASVDDTILFNPNR